jgi:hypothetical protein
MSAALKTGDQVRIIRADLPVIAGELPPYTECRLRALLGIKDGCCEYGEVLAVEANGDIRFTDWQRQQVLIIPAKHIELVEPKDVTGKVLTPGMVCYVAVKNEQKRATVVGISNWRHHGCGWCELGVRFRGDDGKCFSNHHTAGRVAI